MGLNVKAFSLACGITWGLGVFLLGLIATFTGKWAGAVDLIANFYIGFTPTIVGSIIGLVWGFFDALIGGAVIAYLYNKLGEEAPKK